LNITRIEPRVIAEPSGRSYVVLKVMTDEAYAGYGEAPVGADPQATVDRLNRELANEVGANATQTLLADLRLQRADASHGARAALNMALLDIMGKSTKAPLYEVLGGPTRNKARAMAVIDSGTDAQIRSAVLEAKSVGLGFELDEADFAKYPFAGTKPFVSLPVQDDGSIASP